MNPPKQYTAHKLLHKLIIQGEIGVWGGLHIGGSNTAMEIGGLNAEVIRDPVTNQPYIPGSSLKGKMRSLVEVAHGTVGNKKMGAIDNGPCVDPEAASAKLFGYIPQKSSRGEGEERAGNQKDDGPSQPSRILVRDAFLLNLDQIKGRTDLYLTQSKTEVVLDRITAKAMPRNMERVPRHARLGFSMVLSLFESEWVMKDAETKAVVESGTDRDDESDLLSTLWMGLQLLQDDYLGGKGSRGSGQVDVWVKTVKRRPVEYYLSGEGEDASYLSQCHLPAALAQFELPFQMEAAQ